ncbi:sulfatase-like hydrolase/transferase [Labilithrix luteola]|uniref:sulfatase-like hydrolase/transferase n=1 Tax=Labilithrix luteola TaxID=1391654 RepID=UPI001474BAB8|nr:sulfatase-like hydrolase/transferase [Labilithrix luteola]
MNLRKHRTRAWAFAAIPFVLQFVLLDLALRGPNALLVEPRLVVNFVETIALWALVLGLATSRKRRAIFAVLAAVVLAVQISIFRYYHTPVDVQVVTSALHAWRDVKPVVVRALPAFVATTTALAVLEYGLLAASHRGFPQWFSSLSSLSSRCRLASWSLAALVLLTGFFGLPPRHATPDVRLAHALTALERGTEPAVASASAVALPPLLSERAVLPNVLFILTESVRAQDYLTAGAEATASETAAATPGRIDLPQMRAISSYTAVSLSAVLTGVSQEGPRDAVLHAPNLFDVAHAARARGDVRPTVAYYSAQSETVFETKDVRAAVDRFAPVEVWRGKDIADDAEYATEPLDADLVEHFVAHVGELARPSVVMLHLASTHAPYYVDERNAPFRPFGHVVTWSRMPELHNAYRDAIFAQDKAVARAVRAFVEHAGDAPWMVVFTSDHGEAFGEHGAIHHGQNLFDEQVHVPGWIAFGNGALTGEQAQALRDNAARFVTHLDVLPTVVDALGLWDNFGLAPSRSAMRGRSLLRPLAPAEARAPIPVTNCTGMFPCPLNTWGLYDDDHKLVARVFDGDWFCIALGGHEERSGERIVGPNESSDPACRRLRDASRTTFPLLPNGRPNRSPP